jgi:uncharacterized protein YjiS (DUF1127 family)
VKGLKIRHAINLVAEVVSSVAAIATDLARVTRRIATAIRDSFAANTVDQMNDRQLQDVGLSPVRMRAPGQGYASAEAQLGMVR